MAPVRGYKDEGYADNPYFYMNLTKSLVDSFKSANGVDDDTEKLNFKSMGELWANDNTIIFRDSLSKLETETLFVRFKNKLYLYSFKISSFAHTYATGCLAIYKKNTTRSYVT